MQKIGLPYFLDIYSIHKLLKDIHHLTNWHNSACLCNGIIYNLPWYTLWSKWYIKDHNLCHCARSQTLVLWYGISTFLSFLQWLTHTLSFIGSYMKPDSAVFTVHQWRINEWLTISSHHEKHPKTYKELCSMQW